MTSVGRQAHTTSQSHSPRAPTGGGIEQVTAFPEVIVSERVPEEDHFLVMACDGIWDVMSNTVRPLPALRYVPFGRGSPRAGSGGGREGKERGREGGKLCLWPALQRRCVGSPSPAVVLWIQDVIASVDRYMTVLGEADPKLMAEELMCECLTKESRDNMSVVVVLFEAGRSKVWAALQMREPGQRARGERDRGERARWAVTGQEELHAVWTCLADANRLCSLAQVTPDGTGILGLRQQREDEERQRLEAGADSSARGK